MNDAPIAIVGAGPAGLIAADVLSAAGRAVTIYERMPSPARKFLMAGRGGLNLTHAEDMARFLPRYRETQDKLAPILDAFTPQDLIAWANDLGAETFIGSSGRVFPKAMKASPLLRALLARLNERGVTLRTRMYCRGWDDAGRLGFVNADGVSEFVETSATLLALGGASWPRLGADGGWQAMLAARGVEITPIKPSNMGFDIAWSDLFKTRFAGAPLKGLMLRFGAHQARGEAMIADYGLEGGAIYALSAPLRDALETDGTAMIEIDLRPNLMHQQIELKLAAGRLGDSTTNLLRKTLALDPAAIHLLRETQGGPLPTGYGALARLIKAAPLTLQKPRPIDRAISSAGGVRWDAVDERLMLRAIPNVFVAGEMLDWEAPTGGYLLQACFATGVFAARRMLS